MSEAIEAILVGAAVAAWTECSASPTIDGRAVKLDALNRFLRWRYSKRIGWMN